jgi:hypothetical protein
MPSTLRWWIIIGAGLSAAYRLSARGWNVTVRAALHMVDRMEQMWGVPRNTRRIKGQPGMGSLPRHPRVTNDIPSITPNALKAVGMRA